MNKKKVLLNGIALFLMSFFAYFFTVFALYQNCRNDMRKETYELHENVTSLLQKEGGYDEAMADCEFNKRIRLSYFLKSGIPIADSRHSYSEETSLADLQKEVGRYYVETSKSLGETFSYTVDYHAEDGYYVRFGTRVNPTVFIARNFLFYGSAAIILLYGGYVFFSFRTFSKAILALQSQTKLLQDITEPALPDSGDDDLLNLTMMIRDSRKKLDAEFKKQKINEQKIAFILDSFSQGLVVVDASFKIRMFNKKSAAIFSLSQEKALGGELALLEKGESVAKNLALVLKTLIPLTYYEKIDGRIYECVINPIDYSWAKFNDRNAASMLMIDVTDNYNAANMKRDFFANASHELKSPLTAILGYQEMMKEGILTSPEECSDAVNKTIKEAKRMQKIILDMLELSSLENEDLRPIEQIGVSREIAGILDSLAFEIEEKKITVELEDKPLTIGINPDDFDKLFRNLLENAIKYSKEGGKIHIAIEPKKKSVSINDTGIGIAEMDQSRIFERFYRVDKARSRENGGTGLGLAIVKYICNYYDYDIEVKSVLGVGSSFILHLR